MRAKSTQLGYINSKRPFHPEEKVKKNKNLAYSMTCELGNEGFVDTGKKGKPQARAAQREISCCFLGSGFLQPPSC